jgi:hypothetical protein
MSYDMAYLAAVYIICSLGIVRKHVMLLVVGKG